MSAPICGNVQELAAKNDELLSRCCSAATISEASSSQTKSDLLAAGWEVRGRSLTKIGGSERIGLFRRDPEIGASVSLQPEAACLLR